MRAALDQMYCVSLMSITLVSFTWGCERAGSETTRGAPAPEEAEAAEAAPAIATTPKPHAALPNAEPIPTPPDPARALQWAHQGAATAARDAILGGDLSAAREPLQYLSHHGLASTWPRAFQPHVPRTQLMARVALRACEAGSVAEAARALAPLAAACGGCHASVANQRADRRMDLGASTMRRTHAAAPVALWLSLATPSEPAFLAATDALLALKSAADPARLVGLRAAAAQARKAKTWIERAAATGTIYASCLDCHAQ